MRVERFERLKEVDWNFSDYISSLYPADLNTLHWYPATFVPQIPSALIRTLSEPNDMVLDPFSGSGITLVEAARLRRRFIGIDINPYAINIAKAKFLALEHIDDEWVLEELDSVARLKPIENIREYSRISSVDDEVLRWFHKETLGKILALHKYVLEKSSSPSGLIRKVLFSSILNRCSSQRDHYTYITDRCFPKEMVFRDAFETYKAQAKLLGQAVRDFRSQYAAAHSVEWEKDAGLVTVGDSRRLEWVQTESVDLVVTSPPYLGVNDYVRSMRLTYLLMPEPGTEQAIFDEIGARRKRHRKQALEEYKAEIKGSLEEIVRVLKPSGCLCLVVGQGKGKVAQDEKVLSGFIRWLVQKHGFKRKFEKTRRIKFRRIQTFGVPNESIVVLNRA